MYIKSNLKQYVEGIDKSFDGITTIYLHNNTVLGGCYLPPLDSKYYDEQLCTLETSVTAIVEKKGSIITCGDLNSQIGSISDLNGFTYDVNPDKTKNQHGQQLLEICKDHDLLFLNRLKTKTKSFPGNFTFYRNDLKSQNDWFIVSTNFIDHKSWNRNVHAK